MLASNARGPRTLAAGGRRAIGPQQQQQQRPTQWCIVLQRRLHPGPRGGGIARGEDAGGAAHGARLAVQVRQAQAGRRAGLPGGRGADGNQAGVDRWHRLVLTGGTGWC